MSEYSELRAFLEATGLFKTYMSTTGHGMEVALRRADLVALLAERDEAVALLDGIWNGTEYYEEFDARIAALLARAGGEHDSL